MSVNDLLTIYYASTLAFSDVTEFLKKLKRGGYRLLILSNETKSGMQNKISKFHLLDLFDAIYCSADVGMTKRNSELFKYVLEKENIIPEETVFIDDREHNVETAARLGIYAIRYINLEDLKMKLNAIGL